MALTESIEYDKIEVVTNYNAVWTTDVKALWKAKLIADKNPPE